jgi:hypothetical protein
MAARHRAQPVRPPRHEIGGLAPHVAPDVHARRSNRAHPLREELPDPYAPKTPHGSASALASVLREPRLLSGPSSASAEPARALGLLRLEQGLVS